MAAADRYAGGDGRLSPLSTPSATRAVLEAHGIGTKYTLGQNFLVNDDVLRKIVALAEVDTCDRILEVGPGIGTLTIALLKHTASVTAIERDPDLPAVLADTLYPWREKFALIEKDALDVTEGDIISAASAMGERGELAGSARQASSAAELASAMVEPGGDAEYPDRASFAANEAAPWAVSQSEGCLGESGHPASPPRKGLRADLPDKLVANLPYAVAATVVLDYFERFPFLKSATVMVQKEVADRMAAAVGTKNYGAYTVKLGLYAEPAGRFAVGPGNFFPPPRVDSAVIRLNRRVPLMADGSPAAPAVVAAAGMMADAAFCTRRKTLANSCKAYFSGRGTVPLPTAGDAFAPPVGLEGARVCAQLPALMEAAGVDPKRRGETLSQQEFLALGQGLLALAGA